MKTILKNLTTFVSILLAVISILLSYYFYTLSIKEREPAFITLRNESYFSTPKEGISNYVKLVKRSDGKELKKDLFVQEVAFWNNGRETVKKTHIIKPLSINFDGDIEIIDAFISEMKRPDIVKGSIPFKPGGNKIDLNFDILDKNDGFKIRIVYSAAETRNAIIEGVIEGAEKIKGHEELKDKIMLSSKAIILTMLILIGLFLFSKILQFYQYVSQNVTNKLKKISGKVFKKVFGKYTEPVSLLSSLVFSIFVLWMFVSFAYFVVSDMSTFDSVPTMEKIIHKNK